jgi:hypothetical protein
MANHQETVDIFNKHFLSAAESINTKNNHIDYRINNMDNTTPILYLLQSFKSRFQTMNFSYYQLGMIRI